MRVYNNDQKATFKPVKLTIELESLEEVREFYSIFNTATLTNMLEYIDHNSIRKTLKDISLTFVNDAFYIK